MNEQVWRAAMRVPSCGRLARVALGVALMTVFVPGAGQARPAERGSAQNVQVVHVADGLLTIDVNDALLSEILEEIASQSGLTLEGQTSIAERLTVQFQQMRLEDGLRVILDGYGYALEFARDEGDIARVPARLQIFRRSGGQSASSGPADHEAQADRGNESIDLARMSAVLEGADDIGDKWDAIEALGDDERSEGTLPLLRFALTDQDEDVRLAAIDALAAFGGEDAAVALEIALRDPESSIRGGAIDALEAVGGDRAAKSLAIALHDEDADLREQAVEALGQLGSPAALHFIEYAWVVDTDESVRSAAAAWIETLGAQLP